MGNGIKMETMKYSALERGLSQAKYSEENHKKYVLFCEAGNF